MFKTVLTIVLSVAFFGIIFFLIVKKSLKKQLDYYLSGYNASKLLASINLTEISRNALNKSLSEISFFDDAGYSYTPSKINKNVNSAFQLIGFNGKAFVKEGVISTDSLLVVKLQNP